MLLSFLSTKKNKKKKVKELPPALISLDTNPVPAGYFKTFTAGEAFTAPVAACLHTDGKVYRCSSTYTNVVGVAIDSASASGASVRVIVNGVAQAVADGSISIGSRVTYSTSTAGRVVAYGGHSHGVSTSTGTFLTGVSTSTGTFLTGITSSTGSAVTGVTASTKTLYKSTGSFVTGVSKTSTNVVTGLNTNNVTLLTGIGTDTNYSTDSSGYIRHTHSVSTTSGLLISSYTVGPIIGDISTSTANAVTDVNTSSGTAVDTFVSSISAPTGTFLTGVTSSTGSAVTGVTSSTGSALTGVSVNSSVGRVIGIALTSSSAAGNTITILVMPMVV